MLAWRCARGKRRKVFIKKRMVCQEEKRFFVKKDQERIGLSNGKEFVREEKLGKIGLSGREEISSGRRIGQIINFSRREELVA